MGGSLSSKADKIKITRGCIYDAVAANDIKLVRKLLGCKGNPNNDHPFTNCQDALGIACMRKDTDMVALLLENGAMVDGTTIEYACIIGANAPTIECLIEHGAPPQEKTIRDNICDTTIELAIKIGQYAIGEALEKANKFGQTIWSN